MRGLYKVPVGMNKKSQFIKMCIMANMTKSLIEN